MKREKLSSRLGFILLSAGCAIGLGNIWRFPYMVGKYGGGAFVLVYLFFLIILGLPIIVMEYSVGRGSQKSVAQSFHVLEKRTKMAFIFICCHGRKLFISNVLYDYCRVDASLFCKNVKRRFYWFVTK